MAIDAQKLKAESYQEPKEQGDIQKELEEQKEILFKIYEQSRKTKRYILIGRIISFIYFLIVVVPIILAIIYLPPLLENVLAPYQAITGGQNEVQVDSETMQELLEQIKNK